MEQALSVVELVKIGKLSLAFVANNISRKVLYKVLENLWDNRDIDILLSLLAMYTVKLPISFRTNRDIWVALADVDRHAVHACISKYKIPKYIFLGCFYEKKIYFSTKNTHLNNPLCSYALLCHWLEQFDSTYESFTKLSLKKKKKIINDAVLNTQFEMLKKALKLNKTLCSDMRGLSAYHLLEFFLNGNY